MHNSSVIWDFWADKYERLWVQKYSLGPSRREIIKALASILKAGQKYQLLDMGCGTGQLLRELQRTFPEFEVEYTGVDISAKMIEKCREQDEADTRYIISSIADFAAHKAQFDLIICAHSFPYYEDKAKAMDIFHQLLRENGVLLLVQASENNLYDKIILFFVKFTTGKAQYLSVKNILSMVKSKFSPLDIVRIKERFYMPSICLFLLKKGAD